MNHSALRFFTIFSWSRICGRVLRGASNARTVAKTQNLGIFSSLLVSILKVLFVHEWMAFCQIIAALRCTISVFISLHTSQYQVMEPGQVLAPKAPAKNRYTVYYLLFVGASCANPRYPPGVGGSPEVIPGF